MRKCDCLNDCGDDPLVKEGKVLKCEHYSRLHRYDALHVEAIRYRWLCENPDWSFVQELRQKFPNDSPEEFYRRLSSEIDARRR